ncbi:GntR family transcriptional regulator [Clostridium septicum]|uniref:GntR family transcriptional regulator n=1 Tax=Clostridium septicum TaxID=1504 RepID=A0A9N7PLQ7_CLOSE|nr:GntR family transcriptional regulator [Clostridium septicum]AYE35041.1 GntR family transcriptional regulator [Clostridium septicum]MDU1312630.1 GntR family transcriptional regulator [Clostridium septicum]QAS60434.1 GntR family transcriptional regulator [Clostridium septicum]UEC20309.1 GntR family transcriptional regulator [Clostridium septicum]USS01639.1 GntR family transcriptional regulator [Clostridium septicum]
MILRIDFDSETPIYLQIKNQIIQGIAKNEIEDGEELPSVRGLAEDIGVNMHTVNKAYNMLKEDGYIKVDRRKGAIVSLNLEETTGKFKGTLMSEIDYYMAECFNRGISKDDIKSMIDKVFINFKREV